MIEIKGEKTDEVVSRLRQNAPHRCTRVDVCIDFEHAGVFGILHDIVMRMKRDFRLIGERLGDWDYPEQGRTQYVGSKNSPVRVRLYEKGKQPKLVHLNRPHLTRLELQVRPTKEAKDLYSSLSPDDVWGASKWTRHLAGELNILDLQSCPPGTVRKSSQSEFALQHMVRQYSRHLTALAEDTGSWACMGLTLQEMIKANRAPLRH